MTVGNRNVNSYENERIDIQFIQSKLLTGSVYPQIYHFINILASCTTAGYSRGGRSLSTHDSMGEKKQKLEA